MKSMRGIVMLAVLATVLVAGSASAQVTPTGYVFGAPGQARGGGESLTMLHFGGGGGVRTAAGLGADAEIGFLGPKASFSDGVGVFDANGTYYVQGRSRAVPFVTGGYSLIFRNGHSNGWNIGGGVEYFVRPRFGLRFEVRDQIHSEGSVTLHFVGFRGGISFR